MDWNKLFEYKDGALVRKYGSQNQFKHVGWVNSCGYLQTEVYGKAFMVHRIIYEMHHGPVPENMLVDHINRQPLDNRLMFLRPSF